MGKRNENTEIQIQGTKFWGKIWKQGKTMVQWGKTSEGKNVNKYEKKMKGKKKGKLKKGGKEKGKELKQVRYISMRGQKYVYAGENWDKLK